MLGFVSLAGARDGILVTPFGAVSLTCSSMLLIEVPCGRPQTSREIDVTGGCGTFACASDDRVQV